MNTKTKPTESTGFKNIQATGFTSTSETTEDRRVTLREKTEAMLTLSTTAIHQLISGAEELLQNKALSHNSSFAGFNLVTKLSRMVINNAPDKLHSHLFLRNEVELMKAWLIVRMEHCEKDRDERRTIIMQPTKDADEIEVPIFNPDTYITQKLLLLDLREWLIGDVVAFPMKSSLKSRMISEDY